jgi:polysaccharide export outer membrane protein
MEGKEIFMVWHGKWSSASLSFWTSFVVTVTLAANIGVAHGQIGTSGLPQQQPTQDNSQQSPAPIDNSFDQQTPLSRITSDLNQPSQSIINPDNPNNLYQNANSNPNRTNLLGDRNRNDSPVELTGFQRLVAASIGKVLPIYGQNLFLNTPSTFAPVTRIPVTPGYVIGPGDELLIRIWGHVTLDGRFTVDRSGSIFLPKIGAIHVQGISFDHLTDFLKSQIGRTFSNFDLNVNVGQLRSIDILVVGEAMRPGSYTVSSLSTLVNALFSSGGPSPSGSIRNIEVRRDGKVIGTFDFYDLLIKGDKSKDIRLVSGDVVYIPPIGRVIALAGSLGHPALYELRNETSIKDAFDLAGGLTTLARKSQILVEQIRTSEDTRSVTTINLDAAGLATQLQDGDILEVSPIIDRFKDAVTLRGNVADPRRFAWVPGMHVRDLIPDREALLTRDYWEERNKLGMPVLDSTPDVRRYAPDQPISQVNGRGVSPSPTEITQSLPNARDSDTNVYGRERDAYGNELRIPLESYPQVGSNAKEGTSRGGVALGARINSPLDPLSSSSASSAVTDVNMRFPVKNAVILGAPEIDWSYAVIQRLDKKDLTTQLISFNLGKAIMDNDPAENRELMPGDIISVFSTADFKVQQAQQTKFVRLEGEFASAGVYRVASGENLRQLVARVGLAKDAYLFGAEFTRESTRVVQQHRINEYADDLDRRIKLAEANSANNSLNPQDSIATIAALQNARSVAARLRQLSASGRIVLFIPPGNSSLNDIPELPLEDGDAFTVPQLPLTVNVFGAVYNQTSFLYDKQRRTTDYIQYAGGGTRTSDTKRSYIVRANGLVVSRQFAGSGLNGSFEGKHLNPGDTIVVPESVDKRPFLRNLVDISTVIGQLGLGIAAINVLK